MNEMKGSFTERVSGLPVWRLFLVHDVLNSLGLK